MTARDALDSLSNARGRLRVLHVGCGGISRVWQGALRDAPDAEVVGFVDLDIERAHEAARHLGSAAPVGSDLRAIDVEVDEADDLGVGRVAQPALPHAADAAAARDEHSMSFVHGVLHVASSEVGHAPSYGAPKRV